VPSAVPSRDGTAWRVTPPGAGEDPLVTYSVKVQADALARPAYDVVHDALADADGGRYADESRGG
jgi:hypothetical protein